MSKWYPQRTERQLAALGALEDVIKQLARDFQGRRALNFYHESELAAYLTAELRRNSSAAETVNGAKMHLAHLEWPCLPRKRIDLVLWQPGACKTALDGWRDRGRLAKRLPLLAAVQIKRGPGRLTSWSDTKKDLNDLETLYTMENLEKPVLYFLEWVDHGLQEHENDRIKYREIQSRLKEWCTQSSDRCAFVISRDRVGFACPKEAWLVDPLPPGTIETL